MTRILTPEEFIIRTVNEYPSLYASPSYEETKFRILDHVLNTIGNGMCMESFMGEPVTEEEIQAAQKWFRCERAAYGYTKVKTIGEGDHTWQMPAGDPDCVVCEDEKELYPHITYWVEFDCDQPRAPHPNFQKQYSAVWDNRDIMFTQLGKEWAQAAAWFYSKCHDFFLDSERVKSYHTAFPKPTERETKNTIADYRRFMGIDKYPTNEDITKAYECEFIGDRNSDEDVAKFITRRWNQEHQKILNFLDETIAYTNQLS